MKKIVVIVAFLVVSSLTIAQRPDDIVGKYHLPNGLDIEIFKKGNEYLGKIVGLDEDNTEKLDVKNPDKSQRNDPLLGKVIITGLKYDEEDHEWVDGKMYGPDKGMYFNLKITEVNEKDIVVVGSKLIFWKTLKWEKIL